MSAPLSQLDPAPFQVPGAASRPVVPTARRCGFCSRIRFRAGRRRFRGVVRHRKLGSVSRVFEGLSAFRSADALRFGYHIPATAPNPQTRFALAHRASQSHGPFKRHEEPLPFLVSPAVFSKWASGLGSGCECMRGGRIQRGSARCALTLRRGTQKSLGHSPVEPFRPTAVSGGRINNPERSLNLFRGLSAACESRRLPGGSVSVPSDIGSAFLVNCQRSGSRSEGPRHNYQGSHRPLAKAGVAGNGLLERSVLSLTGGGSVRAVVRGYCRFAEPGVACRRLSGSALRAR